MNQSALVGGALLAGFALFLAARNRLGVYGSVLWGAKSVANPSKGETSGSSSSGESSSALGKLINPFDWELPELPNIPDLGHMGF